MGVFTINPPNKPLVDSRGYIEPEWYRFLVQINNAIGAPDSPFETAQFLTLALHNGLGAERVLTPASGQLIGTDGGANSSYTLGLANTAVVAGAYGGVTKTVSFTVDAKGRLTAAAEAALNTDNIAEGATNLYFTNDRARSALSNGTGMAYSSATGVIAVGATLAAYAGGDTPSAFTLSIVDSTDATAWRAAIGAGTSSTTGTVTSVSGSGGTTGLTLTGGPITTSGTLTLGGTLITSNGGTGLSSYTAGDMVYYASGTALTKLGIGTANYVLTSSGSAPQWTQNTGTGNVARASQPSFTTTIGVGGASAAGTGAGISFPATQSASSDANTLDDYEEGTWTPVLTFTTPPTTPFTMDVVAANYTKIGRAVHIQAFFRTDSVNTAGAAGFLVVTGLPFSSASYFPVHVTSVSNWVNAPDSGYVDSGSARIFLLSRTAANGATALMGTGDVTTGVTADQNIIMLSGIYYV